MKTVTGVKESTLAEDENFKQRVLKFIDQMDDLMTTLPSVEDVVGCLRSLDLDIVDTSDRQQNTAEQIEKRSEKLGG